MPTVTREIHIDAPPHEVRRHVADPERRRGWLDDEVGDGPPSDGRVLEYPSPRGPGQVRIEVVPEGEGSRVTVTEEVELPTGAPQPDTGAIPEAPLAFAA